MSAFGALVRRDLVLFLGNRRALLMSLVAPVLIAAFLGTVLGGAPGRIERVPLAVVDLDRSVVSRDIIAAMAADATFDLRSVGEAEAVDQVRRGRLRAAVVIPAGFGAAAASALLRPAAARPELVLHYDPAQSMALAAVRGLLSQHVMQTVGARAFGGSPEGLQAIAAAREDYRGDASLDPATRAELVAMFDGIEKVQRRTGAPPAVAAPAVAPPPTPATATATDRTAPVPAAAAPVSVLGTPYTTRELEVVGMAGRRYNPYAHSFAGMGVQFILLMGVELGMLLLLARRTGIWQRLRAAPLSRATLLGSRIVSATVIAFLVLAGVYAAAIAAFGVRIEGSLVGFAGVALAFSLMTACIGLLIASVGRTPEVTRGLAIVLTLLLVMLGGAWVPTFVFPTWLQGITQFVPTRWAIDGLEATTWRGLGLEAVLPQIGAMLGCSLLCGVLAVRLFRWQE